MNRFHPLISILVTLILCLPGVLAQDTGKYYVYYDAGYTCNHFLTQKIEGNSADLDITEDWTDNPCAGLFSIRVEYKPESMLDSAAYIRRHQAVNTGISVGVDLRGAVTLRVGARGESGSEQVELFMRDGSGTEFSSGNLVLTRFWTFYEIALTGVSLDTVQEGLGIRFRNSNNPSGAVIYLDDITYEFEEIRFMLHSNATEYGPGDWFELEYDIVGPDSETGVDRDLYVLLEVGGMYWFWPGWTDELDFTHINTKEKYGCHAIMEFHWPELFESIDGICFWGALLDPVDSKLTGEVQKVCIAYRGTQGKYGEK